MLVTTLAHSDYVGRIGIGRVFSGSINQGEQVVLVKRDGSITKAKVGTLEGFEGLGRHLVDAVHAGDLCAVSGVEGLDIGDTLADPESPVALPTVTIDEPTLSMIFRINDSPFAGAEGKFVTSRQLRSRLEKELEHNVALKVEPGAGAEEFIVSGRGILHLGILLETMRREGFELAVGRPHVITKIIDGTIHEPIETLVIDAPNSAVGSVMELIGARKGELKKMEPRGDAVTHLVFEMTSRALIGLRGRILTATQGEAIMHHRFERYEPLSGDRPTRLQGVMIAIETGSVTAFSIEGLHDRGIMFVKPGEKIYMGQVVGEHNKDKDLPVKPTKAKQLTNMRMANKEATVTLKAPRTMSLEQCMEYVEEDELVEITPKNVRLRKKLLGEAERRRENRRAKSLV